MGYEIEASDIDSSVPDSSNESFDSEIDTPSEPEPAPELPEESDTLPEPESVDISESESEPTPELCDDQESLPEPESTTDIQFEPEPVTELPEESEASLEPEITADVQSEPELTSEITDEPESVPEPESMTDFQLETELVPELPEEPEASFDPEITADVQSEPELTSEITDEPESVPEPESMTDIQLETEPVPELPEEPEASLEPEVTADVQLEPELTSEITDEPESVPEPESMTDIQLETELVPELPEEPEASFDPEITADVQPESEPDSDISDEPESFPEPESTTDIHSEPTPTTEIMDEVEFSSEFPTEDLPTEIPGELSNEPEIENEAVAEEQIQTITDVESSPDVEPGLLSESQPEIETTSDLPDDLEIVPSPDRIELTNEAQPEFITVSEKIPDESLSELEVIPELNSEQGSDEVAQLSPSTESQKEFEFEELFSQIESAPDIEPEDFTVSPEKLDVIPKNVIQSEITPDASVAFATIDKSTSVADGKDVTSYENNNRPIIDNDTPQFAPNDEDVNTVADSTQDQDTPLTTLSETSSTSHEEITEKDGLAEEVIPEKQKMPGSTSEPQTSNTTQSTGISSAIAMAIAGTYANPVDSGKQNINPVDTPESKPNQVTDGKGPTDTFKPAIQDDSGDIRKPSMPADTNVIKDLQGRDVTIRRWGDDNLIQLRAYDSEIGEVPETPNLGTAGMANLKIESGNGDSTVVRLQDIVIPTGYQKSGIAGKILDQTLEISKAKGASEIFGVIENKEALDYWMHMEEKGSGWKVDRSQGAHGYVRYDLSSSKMESKDGIQKAVVRKESGQKTDQSTRAKTVEFSAMDAGSSKSPEEKVNIAREKTEKPAFRVSDHDIAEPVSKKITDTTLKAVIGDKLLDSHQDNQIIQKELNTDEIRQVLNQTVESANDIKDLDSKEARKNLYQKTSVGTLAEQLCCKSTGSQNLNEIIPNFPWADCSNKVEIQQIKSHVNTSMSKALSEYSTDFSNTLGAGKDSTIDKAVDELWKLRTTDKWNTVSENLPPEIALAADKTSLRKALLDNVVLRIPADDVPKIQDYIRKNAFENPQKYGLQEPTTETVEKLVNRIKPITPNLENHQIRLMAKDVFQRKMEIAGYPKGVAYAKYNQRKA
jgi:hypothetical protein